MVHDFGGKWQWPVIWQYEPLKQPNDADLDTKRNQLNISFKPKNVLSLFPSTTVAHVANSGECSGVCFHNAMRRTLGLSDEQFKQVEHHILGSQDWITTLGMPYQFFDQTNEQKPDYLVTYTPKGNNFYIQHFGVVIDAHTIRSKFGISSYTYDHKLWHIPLHWGNRACLWKLKQIYQDDKNLLFNTLLQNAQNAAPTIQPFLNEYNNELLQVNGYHKTRIILRSIMNLNIDIRNNKGQTPLMIAAEKNNLDFVTLYIRHHADLNLQDNTGNTALKIATDNKYFDIVQLLLDNGANPNKDIL
jgi:hypothetical protein